MLPVRAYTKRLRLHCHPGGVSGAAVMTTYSSTISITWIQRDTLVICGRLRGDGAYGVAVLSVVA